MTGSLADPGEPLLVPDVAELDVDPPLPPTARPIAKASTNAKMSPVTASSTGRVLNASAIAGHQAFAQLVSWPLGWI
jgi:hypothetical protein